MAVNLWTLAIAPVLAVMQGGESFGAALGQLIAGEAPTMEGYFLLSLAVSLIAYVIGAEIDKRAKPPEPEPPAETVEEAAA